MKKRMIKEKAISGVLPVIIILGVAIFFLTKIVVPLFVSTLTFSNPESDVSEVIITLKRTGCLGTCPIYDLVILGNGEVTFVGKRFVKKGTYHSKITPEKVRKLADEFDKSGFFSLNDNYTDYNVTDYPSVITSLLYKGRYKNVYHYTGDRSAPETLNKLEDKIDQTVNINQWRAKFWIF